MKVKILTNIGTNDFPESPFVEGEIHEVGESLGQQLLKRKMAEEIIDLKAVPPIELKAADAAHEIPVVIPKQEQPVEAAPQPVSVTKKTKEK